LASFIVGHKNKRVIIKGEKKIANLPPHLIYLGIAKNGGYIFYSPTFKPIPTNKLTQLADLTVFECD
jgi:hypothetical protein